MSDEIRARVISDPISRTVPTREQLAELWVREWVSKGGLCVFCLNSGLVGPPGDGRACVCPNGRRIRQEFDALFAAGRYETISEWIARLRGDG